MADRGRKHDYRRSRYGQVYGNTAQKQQPVSQRYPARIEVRPTGIEARPTRIEVRSAGIEARPTRIEVRPAGIEARPTRIEVRPTGIEARPTRIEVRPARMEVKPVRQLSNATRKNRDKAHYMNMRYVLFLVSALIVTGFILTVYLGLQSDVTNSTKHIAQLEKELNNLQRTNDREYSRITNNIDLEEIKRIAILELGMGYAEEGQIIDFEGNREDYVRQIADVLE